MRLRSIVAASGAMFLAAVAYVFFTSREPPVAVRHAAAPALSSSAPPVSSTNEPARPMHAEARIGKDAAAADEWSRADSPAQVAGRWRGAKDQRAFFDHALKMGTGAYLHFAMEALTRCHVVNERGMVGAEQDMVSRIWANDPARARRLEAYRSFIQGCEGFETRAVSRQEAIEVNRHLYEADDTMGLAHNVRPYPDSVDGYEEQRDAALKLLETRDPYVLKLVAPYLAGRRAGNLTWDQLVAGDPAAEAFNREVNAWNIALCELGFDCGPSGPYGNILCFGIGKCDWKSADEIAPILATSGGLEPVPGRKDEIVAAVRAGDWAKLGL